MRLVFGISAALAVAASSGTADHAAPPGASQSVRAPIHCAVDADCVGGYCDTDGACHALERLGAGCDYDAWCLSGHCVDGACCDSACDAGPCQVCAAIYGATADGACTLANGNSHAQACDGYLCNGRGRACPTSCESDANCEPPVFACVGGVCSCAPGYRLCPGSGCLPVGTCCTDRDCHAAPDACHPRGLCFDGSCSYQSIQCRAGEACADGRCVAPHAPAPISLRCSSPGTLAYTDEEDFLHHPLRCKLTNTSPRTISVNLHGLGIAWLKKDGVAQPQAKVYPVCDGDLDSRLRNGWTLLLPDHSVDVTMSGGRPDPRDRWWTFYPTPGPGTYVLAVEYDGTAESAPPDPAPPDAYRGAFQSKPYSFTLTP